MMLVSDSRDAAFVVNSVVRRSSLSSASLRRVSLLVAKLCRAAPKCWMSPFSWSTLLRAACLLATGSLLASISSLSLLAQSVSSLPLTWKVCNQRKISSQIWYDHFRNVQNLHFKPLQIISSSPLFQSDIVALSLTEQAICLMI